MKGALTLAHAHGGLALGIVHVVTQQDLDKTGELFRDDKRRAAIEALYPVLWKRVGDEVDESNLGEPEMDVIVRFAPVHLVQSQTRIARELVQVAIDQGANRIVLGRTGRPGSVSEWLLERCELEPLPPEAPPRSLVLRVDPARLDVEPSTTFSTSPKER